MKSKLNFKSNKIFLILVILILFTIFLSLIVINNKIKSINQISNISSNINNEETKYSLNNLSNDDNFIICSLYSIKTKKITRKNLAKIFNCTQSCIAKKHNKILNLIKEYLDY